MSDIIQIIQLRQIQGELDKANRLLKEKDLREQREAQQKRLDAQKQPAFVPTPKAPAKFNLPHFKGTLAKLKESNDPINLPALNQLLQKLELACDKHASEINPYLEKKIEEIQREGRTLLQEWTPKFEDRWKEQNWRSEEKAKQRKSAHKRELLQEYIAVEKAVALNRSLPAPPRPETWPSKLATYIILTSLIPIDTGMIAVLIMVGDPFTIFASIWVGKLVIGGLLVIWGKKTGPARLKKKSNKAYNRKVSLYKKEGAEIEYCHHKPQDLILHLKNLQNQVESLGINTFKQAKEALN